MVGTDLYKVTQEVTDAVDVMAATKSLGGGTIEEVLGGERELECERGGGEGGKELLQSTQHRCSCCLVFPPRRTRPSINTTRWKPSAVRCSLSHEKKKLKKKTKTLIA